MAKNTYKMAFVPFILLGIGFIWLIMSYIESDDGRPTTIADRADWQSIAADCTVVSTKLGAIYEKYTDADQCVIDSSSSGCLPLCIALMRCTTQDFLDNTPSSSRINGSTTELWLTVYSMRAVFMDRAAVQPCGQNDTKAGIVPTMLLVNPERPTNYSLTLFESSMISDSNAIATCHKGDFEICCTSCSMTESREQVRELASDARIETFIAMIGPAVALICVGAFLIIGWVCLAVIQHQRAQAQPPRPRELHAAPMYRESDSEDEAVNRRGGRRARAAPVAAVEEGERDLPQRERRRRRGRRAQPSAPPIDGDDNDIGDDNVIDDDFDTSPSEPVFRCKTCQMPIPASGDALACSSCGKVSVELLERTAFAFAGGGDVQTCTVCLEDIEANERVITLRCAHIYHIECISEWLLTKKICPQCLTEVT